jgi:transposase
MGRRPGHAREPLDHRPRAPSSRLVPQKKTLIATERDPWQRAAFAVRQADWDATQIVVLDEMGSKVKLTPTHAWAPLGERALASVPRNTPINTTTIASLTHAGIGPSLIVSGSVDRVTFTTYLEQVLAPTLRPGQVVLVDNLSAHTSPRAQAIVAACGATLLYLPPYSPDYSPIELAFAHIKADLRRAAARTREALAEAIATALQQISAADARAFFEHCGYHFPPNLDQWFCT